MPGDSAFRFVQSIAAPAFRTVVAWVTVVALSLVAARLPGWTGPRSVFAAGIGEDALALQTLRLATAAPGGRHHRTGEALARLWNGSLSDVRVQVMPTGGNGQNVQLLVDGDADLAILTGEAAYEAARGEGPWARRAPGGHADLRLLAYLYPEVAHFVTVAVRSGRTDSAEWRVAVGLPGSRDEHIARSIIGAGETEDGGVPVLQFLDLEQGLDFMRLGWIDGVLTLQPVPASLEEVLRDPGPTRIGVRSLEPPLLDGAAAHPWTFTFTIPEETYPHQGEPVRTFGVPVVLAVRADMDEQVAYRLARSYHEGRHLLDDVLPTYRWVPPRFALEGVPLPLHPGAERHWREMWETEPVIGAAP